MHSHNIEQMRLNDDVYIDIASCLREAHCIMWILLYHRAEWTDVAAAGWNLDHMRDLQAEMVDWAHEGNLEHTKLDVDAICHALQDVHDNHARCLATQTAEAPKQQTKAAAPSKKRDHSLRVYRQAPVTDQGTLSAHAVILPGLNGVAYQQVTSNPTIPGARLVTIREADDADGDGGMMTPITRAYLSPFSHRQGLYTGLRREQSLR